ncbi:MAG: hypothetical protein QXJ53_03080 [Candidatus Bathyarchaeia archaeon]
MQETEPLNLYLVKNLRGILYFSCDIDPKVEIDWLKGKFRYREIGVSESLGMKLNQKWKKLAVLPKIEDDETLDSLLQASKFICPLIILKEESLNAFKNAVVVSLKTKEKLSDKDLKFNIRLVNYAITDFYLKSIELAKLSDMDGRRKLAEQDLKRFWRIKPSEEGKTMIAYVDPLLIKPKIMNPTFMSVVPCLILDF